MWDKITVGKFQQLHDIIAGQFTNEFEKQLHLLATLEDNKPEHYEAMPMPKYKELARKVAFLSVGDIPKVDTPKELVVNGTAYRVIYDFRELTAGQFIDGLNQTRVQEEHVMRLHKILAAIAVPVGKKYLDVPTDKVAEDMLSVNILEAQAVALFFCDLWNAFLKRIPTYLARKVRKGKKGKNWKQLEAALKNIGVGSMAG